MYVADVTFLIVNFRTLRLTARAVNSVLEHYAHVDVLVIDNGSGDSSTDYIAQLPERFENVQSLLNSRNRYHGPALDQGMRTARTPYVFTLDSDCEIGRPGFLESMLTFFNDPQVYAVGSVRYKNRFGYTEDYGQVEQPDLHPSIAYPSLWAMLIDRSKYLRLHRFIHHGAPAIKNMRDAKRRGYSVRDFPINDFIVHDAQGTSSWQGYGPWATAKQWLFFRLGQLDGLRRNRAGG
jgi:glycosyltransferase involved in cell wall biosynthesis